MTRAKTAVQETATGEVTELRLPALEIQQGPGRRLYTFGIDGKLIPEIATVSRVRRNSNTELHGYQRPENLAHIAAIRRYIDTDDSPMLPNAIVIAFDQRVRFERGDNGDASVGYAMQGHLVIPIAPTLDDVDKPGFIVDGQQRSAAIRDARRESFPICVSGFITDEPSDQRSQFILVNSTKALPKGLIHELLPGTVGTLPTPLMVRQLPATLLERLNFDIGSPLYRRIQTPTNPSGVIKDNSILRMLENSLSDGALYKFRGDNDLPNVGFMTTFVSHFWTAVAEVFSEAWNKKRPRDSRLLHGAGIVAMGFLMDEIARRLPENLPAPEDFAAELKTIKDDCAWTEGAWHFADDNVRKWNDIQNTAKDVKRLTDYLLSRYRARTQQASGRGRARRNRSRSA
ncbi:DGQHR domain-containing protein [Amycolatopsis marina]|uniref:DGQHR domain-containing protein n=1 Tax=Amycolatopsis marina TaxID=490629 RepID=A0A1I1BQX9_9PSEU|nr:DGQHR domain-containing protein DpdB [Amycolatopsis marina]SFB52864.1 DGQHR domain-containing protein [Amycolatopsis marina]